MSLAGAAEVAELRRRLDEAEETLRAIREGEVDALVVRGGEAEQVFHLVGGSESYRAFMESMDLGAAALDEDRRLLYANAALAALLGESAEGLAQGGLQDALGPRAWAALEPLLALAAEGRQSAQVVLPTRGGQRHLVVTVAELPLAFSTGSALTFTDVTERIEAEAAAESERIGGAIMASANEAVVVCDRDGVVTHANAAVLELLPASPIGQRFEAAFRLTFAAGAGPMQADDLVVIALAGGQLRSVEASLALPKGARDLLVSAAPLRQAGGVAAGCIVTLLDLTERKALEKRQALLMRELDHRMKNMLTLVQSISTRTLSTARDLRDFGDRFTQRLAALAATQNLLAEKAWQEVTLEELVAAELAPYVAPRSARIRLEGLGVQVSRDAAVSLGLVFHELVTNAVKYGALSNGTGRVMVDGKPLPEGGLEVCWKETGGPAVRPPEKRGFGQTVIARGLGQAGAGSAEVEFAQGGVICCMRLAADSLV
ncbi:HWE histidine kinase domain-containing protein [Phenylobacterium soli]|uniref:histidine kinase n=1 Tax=Phenylobacterium soli TaxID=2170551 RepID=A0A328AR16_9CAUL|nr:HWE histidine kinase domain-containing protein [Phenylobacterium soli]RAK55954.1 histidine kinase [Phenylobacterium soli]